jgi:O-antigen ligase
MATPTRTTAPADQLRGRLAPANRDTLVVSSTGILLTFVAIAYIAQRGVTLAVAGLVGGIVFVAVAVAFARVPWIAVPIAVCVFTVLQTLRTFTTPTVGAVKDVISLAAVAGATAVFVQRRVARHPYPVDGSLLALPGLILVLYIGNVGGALSGQSGHGAPWLQGTRLFFEPLLLFVAGLVLPEPRRTLRAAVKAVIVAAVVVAVYGAFQQYLGIDRLLRLGYTYGAEVRQIGPNLRSFGTFGEPFSYASFLLLVLGLLLMRRRLRVRDVALLAFLTFGLALSYVRTAVVIGLALLGLALARRGRPVGAALLLLCAAALAAVVLIIAAQQSATRTVPVSPTTYLTLNGRTRVWKSQLGKSPTSWIFGRGVGATGTAAQRAQESLAGKQKLNTTKETTVVDSGYFALMADAGLIAVVLLLAFFARIAVLARRAVAEGDETGWTALAVLTVISLDALSRESFTGFPNAYIGMILLGLCCAGWQNIRTRPAEPV